MTWWMWMALGMLLAAAELASPGGFVIIFFAVAALVVGLLSLSGLVENQALEWFLFSSFAVAALVFFRGRLLKKIGSREPANSVDVIAGETAIATTDMAPGAYGQAELRGSIWKAHNVDYAPVSIGQRCRVVAVDGLMLDVRLE